MNGGKRERTDSTRCSGGGWRETDPSTRGSGVMTRGKGRRSSLGYFLISKQVPEFVQKFHLLRLKNYCQSSETNGCHTYHCRRAADKVWRLLAFPRRSGLPLCRGPASPPCPPHRLRNTGETKAAIREGYSTRGTFLPFSVHTPMHTHMHIAYAETHACTALQFVLCTLLQTGNHGFTA